MEVKKALGLAIGAGVIFMLVKKKSAAGGAETSSTTLTGDPLAGPLNVQRENIGASPTGENPAASTIGTIKTVTAIASTAAVFIPVAGPFISAGIAAAGTIASIIIGATAGKPLDAVNAILIGEMPYGYTGRSNVPEGMKIHALDRYGYLWPMKDVHKCNWSWREVIAVNWKVYSMFPRGVTEVCDIKEIDPMPRSGDPSVLRSLFGSDIRFKLGASTDDHGPWEAGANVPPAPGSPAMWAVLAGDYHPTITASGGEW